MGIPGLSQYIQRAIPITQKTIAAASISATYTLVDSLFTEPVLILIIVSTLNEAVQLSWDGVNDHLAIPVTTFPTIIPFKENQIIFPGNFGVYVKEIGNPTTGSLYIGGFSL